MYCVMPYSMCFFLLTNLKYFFAAGVCSRVRGGTDVPSGGGEAAVPFGGLGGAVPPGAAALRQGVRGEGCAELGVGVVQRWTGCCAKVLGSVLCEGAPVLTSNFFEKCCFLPIHTFDFNK